MLNGLDGPELGGSPPEAALGGTERRVVVTDVPQPAQRHRRRETAAGRSVKPARNWRSTLIRLWPRSASISSKNNTSGRGHSLRPRRECLPELGPRRAPPATAAGGARAGAKIRSVRATHLGQDAAARAA